MNWKVFDLKYDKRESWTFEQMSYLLFCAEFENRIGLFRYKNQTGIETEPFKKDEKFYGFQAKYYTTSISENKDDIIDSITKAKFKNSQLTDILLYVNQELSESSLKSKKKAQYQIEIEKTAKDLGLNIHWRVPSHFELQLSLPENKYLYDTFFSLELSVGDLIDEVSRHNENILQAIETEIPFGNKQIKIDRSAIIEAIGIACQQKGKNMVISGEGGCGKTAIFKEFYGVNSTKIPICVFKANELNVNHINDVFQLESKFTFTQFLNAYKDEPIKIFVIDSAEKLAEISNNDILTTILQKLKEKDWNVIFTTRYAYLNDLVFHINENYQLSFEVKDIPLIGTEELKSISDEFKFSLPNNQKFLERLRNLFYLSEYIQQYSNIDKQGNFIGFIDLLWKKRIQNNTIQKNNLHLEREKCIIEIAKKRCETGRFYINADRLPQPALFKLKQDEILGYNETHDGYFITHDIYEEWTLNKVVTRCFSNQSNTKQFFDELGNSLPIRRAFRLWLSEHLSDNSTEIQNFIQEAFKNAELTQFWQDEILISVLLSDYSESFFKFFETEIIANDFKILKRILFLLRIACTDISSIENLDIIKPKGKGWEEVISIIYKFRSAFFEDNLKIVLPVLTDWCDYTKNGTTTRHCGLLTLSIIQKTETNEDFFIHNDAEENILKVVFNASNELKSELKEIFDKVLLNKWTYHNEPYEGLCSKILDKPYIATDLILALPLSVIQLCDLFWQKQNKKNDGFEYDRDSMKSRYGLTDKHKHDYHPASANQTPIRWLFKADFYMTLDFIIDFTNRAVELYSQSDYGKQDVIEIDLYVEDKVIKQYLSQAIWSMYRGYGSPVVPYLLQSIHMALERILLELAPFRETEMIEEILLKILSKSKSASLTSVVCSVILANPDRYYSLALGLFRSIELFHIDNIRCSDEHHSGFLSSFGYGMDKLKDILYTDERTESNKKEHRSSNLERLLLNYQFFGVNGFSEEQNSEFIESLYKIIDQFKSDNIINKSFGILLARMDRRNLKSKVVKHEDNHTFVEFTPKELPDELRKESDEATNMIQDMFKYSSLKLWSNFINGNRGEDTTKNEEYDKNPHLALLKTKKLVEELKIDGSEIRRFDESIPAFSCSKLMVDHRDKLQKEDKDFCKEVIISNVSRLFSDDYDYQISDGVEASIHGLSSLINEYPDEVENFISAMIFILFDENWIGQYKRICDYAIESIHKSKLWEQNQTVAQSILFGYIKFKPIYKGIIAKKKKEQGHWSRISKSSILDELDRIETDFTFKDITIDTKDIKSLSIHDLEIVYQLIPSDTKDKIHLDIYTQSLQLVASTMLMDRRSYKDEFGDDAKIYTIRRQIFQRFSNFVLRREVSEIDIFLKPFTDCFSCTDETATFIEQIILAEDGIKNYEQFWHIWHSLYPKIKEISTNTRNYHLKEIIVNYLLAWRWWGDEMKEWHSLKNENLSFYSNASKEMGNVPSVLYSITRVLNSIGSNFKNEGIDWIYAVVSNHESINLDDLESHTLYYLEKYLRKFIFINRQKIKEEIILKNKVIPILDFIIERGSKQGYLLRESIL